MKLFNVPSNTWVVSLEKKIFKLKHLAETNEGLKTYCINDDGQACKCDPHGEVEILNYPEVEL